MAPLRVVLILMQCVLGHAIPQALVRNVVEWRIPTVTTELATIAALRVPDHSTSDQSKEKIASHNDKPTSSTASESPNIPDHQILRRDVLFDSTLWDSFPVCSKTCIIENFGNVCGSKFTPSVYSQCICRENLDKENAAAENVANSCPAELNDTAVRFVDACANTNNGGSKLGVSGWMTHAKITDPAISAIASSTSSTTSSTPTTTDSSPLPSSDGLTKDQSIGLGVGLGIGVPALIFAALGVYLNWLGYQILRNERRSIRNVAEGANRVRVFFFGTGGVRDTHRDHADDGANGTELADSHEMRRLGAHSGQRRIADEQ